jgi:hypothetical protein
MKYILVLLPFTLAACNNIGEQQKTQATTDIEKIEPYYKVSDAIRLGHKGNVQQVNDTSYTYKESDGLEPTLYTDAYEVRLSNFAPDGSQLTTESFFIMKDSKQPGTYKSVHKYSIVRSRVKDTTIMYGIRHDYPNGESDTADIGYIQPISDLAYTYTQYKIDRKTRQRSFKQKYTDYMDKTYFVFKTIINYPDDTVSDTVTYTKPIENTNVSDTTQKMIVLAKDSVGNPTIISDRSNPSRKELRHIGYRYY